MPIQQVKTIQGQKRLLNLSGSVPTGNPVGTLLTTYKKIQPRNYLYCDGRDTTGTEEELRTHYPALYLYLGSNVLPDYRECVMVGAEQNTTDTIATHDVYEQGQFKDDQMQKIEGSAIIGNPSYVYAGVSTPTGAFKQGTITQGGSFIRSGSSANDYRQLILDSSQVTRTGTPDVTHSKQKAVYVYIKAVDGVDISDEDSFLTVVENYIDEKNSYSETETITGGKWIDGKPIYRKVVPFTVGNSSTQYVNHNITDYETIVGLNGYVYNTTQGARSLDFSYYGSTTWCSGISFKATRVLLEMGSAFVGQYTGASAFIIIEYTKTS